MMRKERNANKGAEEMTREEIAAELLANCPVEAREDHETIADMIREGHPWPSVINAADEWPETYVWLKNNPPTR